MSASGAAVKTFFESYRAAFERYDASGIADHFAFPAHMTSDADQIELSAIPSKEEWIDQLKHLVEMYRAIGVSSARILELTISGLSPRVVYTTVRWGLYDRTGALLYDFYATYTMVSMGGALRISALAHNEMPQSRDALKRIQRGS